MTDRQRCELTQLASRNNIGCMLDKPLAPLTTWSIGGPADVLLQPQSPDAIAAVVKWCGAEGVPWRVLGGGSNVLIPDEGVPGVVFHLPLGLGQVDWEVGRNEVWVAAGYLMPRLARQAAERGLRGVECVVGVPGTIGGGIVTNAGVPDGTLADVLVEVEALYPDGQRRTWPVAELGLGHRTSRFRAEQAVILGARLRLEPDDPDAVRARMTEHLVYRRATQPLNQHTAGSVFRRPAEGFPGQLLEAAGCKGLRHGDAVVSERHANWIENHGAATAADVLALIDEMRARVLAHSGVELELEVLVW